MFYEWIEEFARRRREWTTIPDVNLSKDRLKYFFNAVTFYTILKAERLSRIVLFFSCKPKTEQHEELTIYACGVDTSCQIITDIYKGRPSVSGDPDMLDDTIGFDELKKGQINWISRNLCTGAAGFIDPYNEFNGYAHSPDYLKKTFFEMDKPDPAYKKAAVYLGVDTREEPRNTVVFIGVFKDDREDLPPKTLILLDPVDNGAQCCPIPG
ncbi:hypothetical protein GCM10028803_44630 [Larkinella knui]